MASHENYEIPESGAVFTFGRSGFADNQQSHFFIRNDPVVEISCGDEHTAVVCCNGRLFLFGQNDYGQLGLGHTRTVTKPSCLKYLKPFHSTHVACGKGHTVVSTKCKRLFSFGSNSDGQLGTGDMSDKTVPQLVNTKHFGEGGISMVSAGCFHSACLTDTGELYMWGSNSEGQCGAEVDANLIIPTKVQFENPIVSVSCGYYHTAFLSEGNLYTFGEEDNGKLGYRKTRNQNLPEKVELDFVCTQVECGGNHTLILSDKGKAFGCGSNFSGQLGLISKNAESYCPVSLNFPEDLQIALISAGESHSAFITSNGELYMCGDGRYGKTCCDENSVIFTSPTLITLFINFECIFASCGGCQTMVLARRNNESLKADTATFQTNILSLPPLKVKGSSNDPVTVTKDQSENSSPQNRVDEIIENHTESHQYTNISAENENKLSQIDCVSQFDDVYVDIQGISNDRFDDVKRSERSENIPGAVTNDSTEASFGNDGDTTRKSEGTVKKFFSVFKSKMSTPERTATVIFQNDANFNEKTDNIGKTKNTKFGNEHRSRACSII